MASVSCSRLALASIAAGVVALAGAPADAKVFYSQKQALELAFPDADRIETDTRVLSRARIVGALTLMDLRQSGAF